VSPGHDGGRVPGRESALQPDPDQPSMIHPDHQLPSSTDPEKPGHRISRPLMWILLLCFFAVGFYLVLRPHGAATPAGGARGAAGGAVALTSTTAKRGSIGVYVDAIGTVVPVYTSSITSEVNGLVTAVHFKEGQLVRKGEPLIEIDSRPYKATLMEAQGILERDQGILAQAQMDLARYQAAWAKNALPKQTLDDQAKLVQQVQGTVKNDQGTVAYDQVQVDFCHIVAPIAGRVGLRLVDPGNVVQANGTTVLAVVTQIQPITVVFTVAEDSLGEVLPHLRQKGKLTVDAFDRSDQTQLATGTLLTLDNLIDTTTGTVKARAEFANKDSALFPNQFVNAHLLVNTLNNATLIPTDAVQHNGEAAFVYVLASGKAHLKPITVGVTEGEIAQVTGINPGDVLATSGFDKLQDGTPVTLADASGAGAGKAGSSRTGGAKAKGSGGIGTSGSSAP
jgi:multidrug efflux system membrane fusion protein